MKNDIIKNIEEDSKNSKEGSVEENGCISFWGGDLTTEEASLVFGDIENMEKVIEKAKEINKLIGGK